MSNIIKPDMGKLIKMPGLDRGNQIIDGGLFPVLQLKGLFNYRFKEIKDGKYIPLLGQFNKVITAEQP